MPEGLITSQWPSERDVPCHACRQPRSLFRLECSCVGGASSQKRRSPCPLPLSLLPAQGSFPWFSEESVSLSRGPSLPAGRGFIQGLGQPDSPQTASSNVGVCGLRAK